MGALIHDSSIEEGVKPLALFLIEVQPREDLGTLDSRFCISFGKLVKSSTMMPAPSANHDWNTLSF